MACSQTIYGIPLDCSSNVGGILEAYLCNYDENIFTVSSTTSGDTIISAITSGATFHKYNFRKGSSNIETTLTSDEANGVSYTESNLVMNFARQETIKRTAIAALALGGLAGIVKDANGLYWALGVYEPVMATAGSASTGTARSDANQYSITLTDVSPSFLIEVPKSVFDTITIADN